jgi:BirA family transcriptional regulator, biotin operon repressor / biotin---[acetyl-CoA-carboxylase] ligase
MTALLFPLTRRLNDQHFHSGEDLAAEFGVTRGTINNVIRQAREMGLEIHAVKGRGYRLTRAREWLDATVLRTRLSTLDDNLQLDVQERVDSTNRQLMQRLETHTGPVVLCAEYQTGGRGRRGRGWSAAPGGSLIFSISWRFERPVGELGGLSLVTGLALVRALSRHSNHTLQLKWPNDVVANYRKLAGILVEIQGEATGPSDTVIGVGVNLALPKALRTEISQGVVDMDELGWTTRRNDLLADCIEEVVLMLKAFDNSGFAPHMAEWCQWHAYHDKQVSLLLPDGTTESGKIIGIDAAGALLVEDDTRKPLRYSNGEVSLRPRHGSVIPR